MAVQAYTEKMQTRQGYRNFWHADLLHTVQADVKCKATALLLMLYPLSVLMLFVCLWFPLVEKIRRLLLRAVVVSVNE